MNTSTPTTPTALYRAAMKLAKETGQSYQTAWYLLNKKSDA